MVLMLSSSPRDISIVVTHLSDRVSACIFAYSVEDSLIANVVGENVRAVCKLAMFVLEEQDGAVKFTYLIQSDPRGRLPQRTFHLFSQLIPHLMFSAVEYSRKYGGPPMLAAYGVDIHGQNQLSNLNGHDDLASICDVAFDHHSQAMRVHYRVRIGIDASFQFEFQVDSLKWWRRGCNSEVCCIDIRNGDQSLAASQSITAELGHSTLGRLVVILRHSISSQLLPPLCSPTSSHHCYSILIHVNRSKQHASSLSVIKTETAAAFNDLLINGGEVDFRTKKLSLNDEDFESTAIFTASNAEQELYRFENHPSDHELENHLSDHELENHLSDHESEKVQERSSKHELQHTTPSSIDKHFEKLQPPFVRIISHSSDVECMGVCEMDGERGLRINYKQHATLQKPISVSWLLVGIQIGESRRCGIECTSGDGRKSVPVTLWSASSNPREKSRIIRGCGELLSQFIDESTVKSSGENYIELLITHDQPLRGAYFNLLFYPDSVPTPILLHLPPTITASASEIKMHLAYLESAYFAFKCFVDLLDDLKKSSRARWFPLRLTRRSGNDGGPFGCARRDNVAVCVKSIPRVPPEDVFAAGVECSGSACWWPLEFGVTEGSKIACLAPDVSLMRLKMLKARVVGATFPNTATIDHQNEMLMVTLHHRVRLSGGKYKIYSVAASVPSLNKPPLSANNVTAPLHVSLYGWLLEPDYCNNGTKITVIQDVTVNPHPSPPLSTATIVKRTMRNLSTLETFLIRNGPPPHPCYYPPPHPRHSSSPAPPFTAELSFHLLGLEILDNLFHPIQPHSHRLIIKVLAPPHLISDPVFELGPRAFHLLDVKVHLAKFISLGGYDVSVQSADCLTISQLIHLHIAEHHASHLVQVFFIDAPAFIHELTFPFHLELLITPSISHAKLQSKSNFVETFPIFTINTIPTTVSHHPIPHSNLFMLGDLTASLQKTWNQFGVDLN